MKQCIKCGELKEDSFFSSGRNQCKECKKQYGKQYGKQYYLDHKEERKQYYLDNKEKIKQYKLDHKEEIKQYRLDHRKKINQQIKQYGLDHKEEIKQYNKQYSLDNKEEIKQYNKQYSLDNKEEIKQQKKQYHQTEAGKETLRRHAGKQRKMKYIPLMNNPFPEDIMVEDHHILNNFHAIDAEGSWNKWFVIPIPKTTHRFVIGTTNNLDHWRHNEEWIRKLYDININELLGNNFNVR